MFYITARALQTHDPKRGLHSKQKGGGAISRNSKPQFRFALKITTLDCLSEGITDVNSGMPQSATSTTYKLLTVAAKFMYIHIGYGQGKSGVIPPLGLKEEWAQATTHPLVVSRGSITSLRGHQQTIRHPFASDRDHGCGTRHDSERAHIALKLVTLVCLFNLFSLSFS